MPRRSDRTSDAEILRRFNEAGDTSLLKSSYQLARFYELRPEMRNSRQKKETIGSGSYCSVYFMRRLYARPFDLERIRQESRDALFAYEGAMHARIAA